MAVGEGFDRATRYARQYQAKVFDEASAAALESALNDWFAAADQATVIEMYPGGADNSFIIIYTE